MMKVYLKFIISRQNFLNKKHAKLSTISYCYLHFLIYYNNVINEVLNVLKLMTIHVNIMLTYESKIKLKLLLNIVQKKNVVINYARIKNLECRSVKRCLLLWPKMNCHNILILSESNLMKDWFSWRPWLISCLSHAFQLHGI